MGVFKKARSLVGKIKHIDFEAKKQSEINMLNPTEETERVAKERAIICISCKHIEDEPIESERVIDEKIPELSNKMCGKCFCPNPKLVRQNIKICKHWK